MTRFDRAERNPRELIMGRCDDHRVHIGGNVLAPVLDRTCPSLPRECFGARLVAVANDGDLVRIHGFRTLFPD
jgi:hypothetical protein